MMSGLQPALLRERRVRVPLVVLRPLARGDENRELAQPRRQHALEAQVVAHRPGAVHHLGTAQQRPERPDTSAFRAAVNSAMAFFCASVSRSAGIGGMRSCADAQPAAPAPTRDERRLRCG